jgi:hypothetical protein
MTSARINYKEMTVILVVREKRSPTPSTAQNSIYFEKGRAKAARLSVGK